MTRLPKLSPGELDKLHHAAMSILKDVGVVFHNTEALGIFARHGVKVNGQTIHLTEDQVMAALKTIPKNFTLHARHPDKGFVIGQDNPPMTPGYGSPFISDSDGSHRPALMSDYRKFCKLVHTSTQADINNFLIVDPSDLPRQTAHLDMLLATMTMSDKPLMSCPLSRETLQDNIDMANILFGGDKAIQDKPVMFPTINPLSPLQYSEEMADAIILHATWGQPVIITNVIQAGASAPVTLAGTMAVQIAEILSGLVLGQFVRPGSPGVYGNSSCPVDMRSGGMALGSPETALLFSMGIQMADYYGLLNRIGGTMTDSHLADIRAGIEGTILQYTAMAMGSHMAVHVFGILSSYLSMSYEKFLADEEMVAMLRRLFTPVAVDDQTINLEATMEVGSGGQHLTRPETFRLCRTEFHLPQFMNRQSHGEWIAQGKSRADQLATKQVEERLSTYERPDIDPGIDKDLLAFVERRKNNLS